MVILNFTVPFALEAIPKGLKKRTMRPVRENPNSVWNRLFIKWHSLHEGMWGCPTCGDSNAYMEDCNETEKCIQNHSKNRIPLRDQCGEYLKIQLQLWWQQRSPFWICNACSKKRKFNQTERDLYAETFKHLLTPELMKPIACKHCNSVDFQKEAHKLADAVLTNMTKRTLGSLTEEEWKADGFDITNSTYTSSRNMGLLWFGETYKYKVVWDAYNHIYMYPAELLDLEIYIIEWELV